MSSQSALLHILQRSGCPGLERFSEGDLEWMWLENPDFLEWICTGPLGSLQSGLEQSSTEMVLTAAEIAAWEELKSKEAEGSYTILKGEVLGNALRAFETTTGMSTEDLQKMSENTIRGKISELNDRLDLETIALDEMTHVSNLLAAKMSENSGKILKLQKRLNGKVNHELRRQYDKVLEINEEFNEALRELSDRISEIVKLLTTFRQKKDGQANLLLSDSNLESLEEEEMKFISAMKELYFALNQCQTEGKVYECLKDDKVISAEKEILWLSEHYGECQKLKLLLSSELEGLNKTVKILDEYLNYADFQVWSTDESLDEQCRRLEERLSEGQNELLKESGERLNQLVKLSCNYEESKVKATYLSNLVENTSLQLEMVTKMSKFAMDQQARQCILFLLIEEEKKGLEQLHTCLKEIGSRIHESPKQHLKEHQLCLEKLKAFEKGKSSDKISFSDSFSRAVLKIIGKLKSDREDISKADASLALKDFIDQANDVSSQRKVKEKELKSIQVDFEHDLPEIRELLHFESGLESKLANPEFISALRRLESELFSLEENVRDVDALWNKEFKTVQSNPQLQSQRKIWVNFMTNPKLMEANIEVMVKKAAAAVPFSHQ